MAEDARLLPFTNDNRPSQDTNSDRTETPEKDSFRQNIPHMTRLRKNSGKIWRSALVITLLALVGALVGAAFHLGTNMSYRPLPEPKNLGSCGATPEESAKKGCVFDFILGAWIHPRCMEHSLYQQYMLEWKTLNMTMYMDPEGLHEASYEYMMGGNYEFIYGYGTFHYLHCSYVFEKNWQVLRHELKAVPSNCVEDEHMYHCLAFTGKPSVKDLTDSSLRQVFQQAPILDCLVYE